MGVNSIFTLQFINRTKTDSFFVETGKINFRVAKNGEKFIFSVFYKCFISFIDAA